jgi:hypothetical protein
VLTNRFRAQDGSIFMIALLLSDPPKSLAFNVFISIYSSTTHPKDKVKTPHHCCHTTLANFKARKTKNLLFCNNSLELKSFLWNKMLISYSVIMIISFKNDTVDPRNIVNY